MQYKIQDQNKQIKTTITKSSMYQVLTWHIITQVSDGFCVNNLTYEFIAAHAIERAAP